MFVFKAAVVGAGTMGGQIAQTIAAAGIPVVLKDINQDLVDAGLDEARNVTQGQVARLVKKGEDDRGAGRAAASRRSSGRIHGTTSYEGFGDVDFVIEAVPERMEIKQAVFAELDAVTPGHAILASNTSSLSITEIGEATLRPDQVVGFHYFYPASVMPLIEIVQGDDTSPRPSPRRSTSPRRSASSRSSAARSRASSSTASSTPASPRSGARRRSAACRSRPIDEGVGAASVVPDGALLPRRPARAGHRRATSPSTSRTSYGDRFYVHQGMQASSPTASSAPRPAATGVYDRTASPTSTATPSPTSTSSSSCSR